jgi:photosystem II stability/assembly factor-like uncharacterized protein
MAQHKRRTKLSFLIILGFCFLLEVVSSGQVQNWKGIGPDGGNIQQIITSKVNPECVYVLNESQYYSVGYKIFKSLDSGNTYQDITENLLPLVDRSNFLICQMAIDPDNADTLYLATATGLFVTKDGGNTFNLLGLESEVVLRVAVNPYNTQEIFAGTVDKGLFRSLDGGVLWTPANNGIEGLQIQYITFDPTTSGTAYTCVHPNSIYKTTDGGNNWKTVLQAWHPVFLLIAPDNNEVIYILAGAPERILCKSSDGGKTWKYLDLGFPFVSAVAIDPENSNRVLVGSPIGVCISEDAGENWVCHSDQFYNNKDVISLAFDPRNSAIIYAGTSGGGLYKSFDKGESWSLSSDGISASFVWKVAVKPDDPDTLYAGTIAGGLYKSVDKGLTWQMKNPLENNSAVWNVFDIGFDDNSPSTIFIGSGCCKGFFKSNDAGESWNEVGDSSVVESFAIDPNNSNIIYADGGKSVDGGKTWTPTIPGVIFADHILIDPKDSSIIYVVAHEIYKSKDSGSTWDIISDTIPASSKNSFLNSIAIDPNNSSILYAGYKGIYKSNDSGKNWSLIGLDDEVISSILVDSLNSNLVYAGTLYDGIYRSEDGGGHWESFGQGLTSFSVFSFTESIENDQRIVYAGTSDGIYSFSESAPSIESVQKVTDPFRLKIKGSNFHQDLKVYIGGDQSNWSNVKFKSSSEIILKGGSSLKSKFPKGVSVEIKVVNGDGGVATYTYKR